MQIFQLLKKNEFECVVTIEKFVLLNDIWAKLCIGTILNMHEILRICHRSKIPRKKSDKDSQTEMHQPQTPDRIAGQND